MVESTRIIGPNEAVGIAHTASQKQAGEEDLDGNTGGFPVPKGKYLYSEAAS